MVEKTASRVVSFRLSPEVSSYLADRANRAGRSLSEYARQVVERHYTYLQARGKKDDGPAS